MKLAVQYVHDSYRRFGAFGYIKLPTNRKCSQGAVFTEAGARWYAPRPSNGELVEIMSWLESRKAANKYVPGLWNQIRIAAVGSRIRVSFNRMHPSADKDRGLGIDFSNKEDPMLKGRIGVRTRNVNARFDNLIVLPADAVAIVR